MKQILKQKQKYIIFIRQQADINIVNLIHLQQLQSMSLSNYSKIEFSQLQIEILQESMTSYSPSEKFQLKKITIEFNNQCLKRVEGFQRKSSKAIQGKINQIFQIKKHFWNFKLDQLLLDRVAYGMKWRHIANCSEFKQHKLTSNQIKRKFQCSVRYKFLCLFREIFKNQKYPQVSDVTFKLLLQEDKIEEQYEKNLIDQVEKQCLLDNIKLFRTSIDEEQQKRQIRSSKTKNKVLSLVYPNSLKLLVNSILKLHQARKNKNVDVVEELLNQNSLTRMIKEGQSTKASPTFFSNDNNHLRQDEEEDKKIHQINYQLTFNELQQFFPLQPNPRDQDILFNDRHDLQRVEQF